MVKPVRPFITREDYEWFIRNFGDNGTSPGKYVLFARVREHIEKDGTFEENKEMNSKITKKLDRLNAELAACRKVINSVRATIGEAE